MICMGNQKKSLLEKVEDAITPSDVKPLMVTFGWVSVAAGAVAVGYFVGRNLRARYLLNRRTPYDYFSHAGDANNGTEFGVGV
jgi:hypothetical protein